MDTEHRATISDDAAPQIDDPKIDDKGQCVETTNVIEQGSASTPSHLEPTMASDVPFNSPSREILGTPFTTDSPYEYPFPNTSSDPSSSSALILSSSIPPLPMPAPVSSNHSHPINGISSAPAAIPSFSPLFSSSFPSTFPAYTITHPKMRATPPPVPPSLKKRQRWTLTIPLIRRRSGQPKDNVETKQTRSASIDVTPPDDTQAVIQNTQVVA